MTPQPNPAGRTRRNLDELKALARDCGWQLSSSLGDTENWRLVSDRSETLSIPTYRGADRFDERYDAALARLTPEPAPRDEPAAAGKPTTWVDWPATAAMLAVHGVQTAPPPSLAERRIAAVLEAIKVGREHGCTTFDLTNLTRMLTEDEPSAEYPVAGHPVDPDDDPFTAVAPE